MEIKKNPIKKLSERLLKGYSKMERKDFPFVIAFLAIPVIQIILFYFYVNFSAILMAFQDSATGAFSLENMREVLVAFVENSDRWGEPVTEMLGKSVLIWVSGTLLSPVGWFVCYILTKHIPCSGFFRAMYSIPGLVGTVVFTTIVKDFFSYDGLVTELLVGAGAKFPIQVIRNGLLGSKQTAFWSVFILNRIMGLAGGGMILAGAYMRIPNELFESAELDGCGFFRETFSIAVPCVWTTLSTMLVFDLCSFFTADMSMYTYSNGTGAFGLNSMGYYLYTFSVNVASGGAKDIYYYASAFGFVITVITVPLVLFGRRVLAWLNDSVEY